MTLRVALLLCCLLLGATGCEPKRPPVVVALHAGVLHGAEYRYDPIGWRFPKPDGWHVLTRREIDTLNAKGRVLAEKAAGGALEEGQTELLYLHNGPGSIFTSVVQRLDPAKDDPARVREATFELVRRSYAQADIPVRIARSQETIGGVPFEVMQVRMLERGGGTREVAQQYVYDTHLAGHTFTVGITSRSASDRIALLAAWRASRFDPPAAATPAPP